MQEEENDSAVELEVYDRKALIVFSDRTVELSVNIAGVQALTDGMLIGTPVGLTRQEADLQGPPEIFVVNLGLACLLEITRRALAPVIPILGTV